MTAFAVRAADPRALRPSPDNPRVIDPVAFEDLKRSMTADPEMLQARPIIALPDGRVVAGHQRLAAALALGWATVPTITVDLDEQRAREWNVRDNASAGAFDDAALAALLAVMAADGDAVDGLGLGADEVARLLALADGRAVDPDHAVDEWRGMPAFEHEDQTADGAFIIRVFLKDAEDVAAFSQLIGRDLAGRKFFWFGKQPQGTTYEVYDEAPP